MRPSAWLELLVFPVAIVGATALALRDGADLGWFLLWLLWLPVVVPTAALALVREAMDPGRERRGPGIVLGNLDRLLRVTSLWILFTALYAALPGAFLALLTAAAPSLGLLLAFPVLAFFPFAWLAVVTEAVLLDRPPSEAIGRALSGIARPPGFQGGAPAVGGVAQAIATSIGVLLAAWTGIGAVHSLVRNLGMGNGSTWMLLGPLAMGAFGLAALPLAATVALRYIELNTPTGRLPARGPEALPAGSPGAEVGTGSGGRHPEATGGSRWFQPQPRR